MALNNIGQNAVEEFFEELLYAVGYQEARNQVKNITKDVDNEVVREALESAMNVLVMGVLFLIIQKQEQYIEKIFNWVYGIVTALVISSRTRVLNKLKRLKGVKLLRKLDFFSKNDNVDVAKLSVDLASLHFRGQGLSSGSSNVLSSVINQKKYLIDKEKFHLQAGEAFSGRYSQTLLFKLFTKKFTYGDKEVLKKILGRDTEVDVDDINKVADFMFVYDSNGNPVGLTEAFIDLLNGLGYVRGH